MKAARGLFLVDPGRGIAETEKRERLCLGWPRIVLAVRVVHVHVLRLDHWTGIGCEVARVGASYISYMAFAGSDTDISSGERVHGDTVGRWRGPYQQRKRACWIWAEEGWKADGRRALRRVARRAKN